MAQPQLALDTTSDQNTIMYTGTVASNGDRVLALRGNPGTVLWRAAADGTPLWARQLGNGTLAPQLAADPSSGTWLLHPAGVQQFSADPSGLYDTLRYHYVLSRMDAAGTLAWATKLTFDLRYVTLWPDPEVRLMAGDDAAFLVMYTHEVPNALSMLKVDGQGQMLWGRSYWTDQLPPGTEVTCGAPDGNGGLFLSLEGNASMWTYVAHVLADGSLDWVKQAAYTNAPVYYNTTHDAAAMPDGSVLMFGRMDIPGHNYLSTLRMSPQGTVTDAHFYTAPLGGWAALWAVARENDGTILLVNDSSVIRLAVNGEVASAVSLASHVDGDQRNRFIPMAMSATGEGAVLPGVLDYVHVDLGYTMHRPGIRTIDPADPGCYTAPLAVGHVPVPTNLYVVTDFTGFEPATFLTAAADTLLVLQPVGMGSTTDLCEVMVATGIQDAQHTIPADLLNTVAAQGDPFLLATPLARRISVLDVAGRCLVKERLYGGDAQAIHTAGMPPGLYLLRMSTPEGTAVRTHRVLVIP